MVDKMEPAREHVSLCDTITIAMSDSEGNPSGQILEVYEHLLHVITDVGLHHAFPERWGISKTSELYAAMREAIDGKVYDVSDYAKVDDEARDRVELQEFAFWALSTVQGVHAEHFKDNAPLHEREWALTTAGEVQAQLPKFWALHEKTTAKWMGKISNATMVQLGNLAPGGAAAESAPWPISGLNTGSNSDTIPAGACDQIPEAACEGNAASRQAAVSAVVAVGAVVMIFFCPTCIVKYY